jgi:ATP-dependent DNA helicase RecG
MQDALLLKDRIQYSIEVGESHFREFKSALEGRPDNKQKRSVRRICEDIAEALVAFANADGGELLIGVEDDGRISGILHNEAEIEEMLKSPITHVHRDARLPMTQAQKLTLESKIILFFQVEKGSREIYQLPDGRCVVRKEKATVPGVISAIQFERQEIRSREYDRQFVDGATVADLDMVLVRSVADEFLRGLSPERYLQQVGLAEYGISGLRLRMAALLSFAKDITRWHPYCQVRILKVEGTVLRSGVGYNVVSDEVIRGNILTLIQQSWENLRPFLAYKTDFGTEARFEQRYVYPELACREALINAIAHRDYSSQSGIEIYIFDDRMEIRNPGALLSTLSVESLNNLEGTHESRNALVARVLRENRYMRELGEGVRRMFELMEQSELDSPKFYSNTTSFRVTLHSRSLFTTQEQAWLNEFKEYHLSRLQKRIVVRGMNGVALSRNAIVQAMNNKDRDTYDKEVTGLREAGILEDIRSTTRQQNIDKNDIPRFRVANPAEREISLEIPIIYIPKLPDTVEKSEIEAVFARFGRIEAVRIRVKEDRKGQPITSATVHFEDISGAEAALKAPRLSLRGNYPLKIRPYQKLPPK